MASKRFLGKHNFKGVTKATCVQQDVKAPPEVWNTNVELMYLLWKALHLVLSRNETNVASTGGGDDDDDDDDGYQWLLYNGYIMVINDY